MNDQELDDLLGALRADTPAMTDDAFATGRARLSSLDATTAVTDTTTGTAAMTTQGAATTTQAASTTATRAGPTEAPTVAPLPERRDRTVRRYAPWLVAAAVLGAVGVAVAVLPGGSQVGPAAPSTNQDPAPSTTSVPAPPGSLDQLMPPPQQQQPQSLELPEMPAQPVNAAGDLAANVVDVPVGPGQHLYIRTVRKQAANSSGPGGELVEEVWAPQDLDLEWLQIRSATGSVQGAPDPDANGGVEEQTALGGAFNGPTEYPWLPSSGMLAQFPADPAGLYARLAGDSDRLEHGVSDPTVNAAAKLINLLAHPNAAVIPADVRATIYRTLGYLPGLVITNGVQTHDGRTATALGHDGGNETDGIYRIEVLVDPATGQVIGSRYLAMVGYGGFPDGTAYGQSAATVAVVANQGDRP